MNTYQRVKRQWLATLIVLCSAAMLSAQDTTVTTIEADGPGDTYELLANALGGSPLEVPDCDHEATFKHIEEIYDEELERHVFKFYIHKEIDTDRCGTTTDRQRNEIKSYDPSPDYLKAIQREVVTYEWFFKIDEGFQPSGAFTHLFQLKAVGGNDSANPLLTITPRKGDPDMLQLIYGSGGGSYTHVAVAELSLIKGQWVKARCKAAYEDHSGSLELSLTLLDGTEVLSYANESIDMWREGSTFVRPKWGIYRSLNDSGSLRDEEVLFADFSVAEVGACPVWYEDADGDGLGDPNSFVYACERPNGYVQNNVDTCLDWYEDADGDGLGNPNKSQYACSPPDGYVDNTDDNNDAVNNLLGYKDLEPLEVYPNPVRSILHIQGTEAYSVFNLSGDEVLKGVSAQLSVDSLPPGIYFLKAPEGRVIRFVKTSR